MKAYDFACIRVALRENITNILVDYPKGIHINELSKIVKIDAKKLVRLMRLLATRGFYNEGRSYCPFVEGCLTLSCISVAVDTFGNNRLSLMFHSENPVRHLVSSHVEVTTKGAVVLYETLKDPKTAYSEDPEDSPFMYANNKEGITGTFFDWMKQQVRKCSIYCN